MKNLRDEHAKTIAPVREQAAEALRLEHKLGDVVNAAYGQTPDEVTMLGTTTPPRVGTCPFANRRDVETQARSAAQSLRVAAIRLRESS